MTYKRPGGIRKDASAWRPGKIVALLVPGHMNPASTTLDAKPPNCYRQSRFRAHQKDMPLRYRAEIDGLRALAVLPVVLFHSGIPGFSGGFIGVDIFFVISGYLITAKIHEDLQEGRFGFLDFFERRARRILPLLLCVLLVSVPLFQFLLTPSDYRRFSHSIIPVLKLTSEIFFSKSGGYFDGIDYPRPLLHTWSLSIEEKYYIGFPLIFFAIFKYQPSRLPNMLAGTTLLFFCLSIWLASSQPDRAYYMFWARIWEILAGANIALWSAQSGRSLPQWIRETTAWMSMAVIGAAIFLYGNAIPYPGVFALLPVACACGLIVCATGDTRAGRILAWRPLVFMGLLSYSIYMWHQPLIVAAEEAGIFIGWMKMATIVLILGCSYLSWRFIEKPFRRRSFLSTNVFLAATTASIAVVLAGSAILNSHARQRLDAVKPRETVELQMVDTCFLINVDHFDGNCVPSASADRQRILLIGDSHAASVFPPLLAWAKSHGVELKQMTGAGCLPLVPEIPDLTSRLRAQHCATINQQVLQAIRQTAPDLIIFAAHMFQWSAAADTHPIDLRWSYDGYYQDFLRSLSSLTKEHPVIVIGQVPVWQKNLPDLIAQELALGQSFDMLASSSARGLAEGLLSFDRTYQKDAENAGAHYISLIQNLCPNSKCLRFAEADDGKRELTTFDYGHLSLAGSEFAARTILIPALLQRIGTAADRSLSAVSAQEPAGN